VALAAPAGNCVNSGVGTPCLYPLLTTTNGGATSPVPYTAISHNYSDGGNDASLGTSFSAPLVSGTLGLMFSINPALTTTQAISILKSTARTFPSGGAGAGVSACQAPSATAQNSECYCSTSTCGAGMLDAHAAVLAAKALVPVTATAAIAPSATSVTVGTDVTLDGNSSSASGGATIAGYQWAISSGAALASFTGATNGQTATLATTGAGSVTVTLTVTGSNGAVGTASQVLTVTDPTAVSPAGPPSGGGGGGGGTMSPAWLLALLAAIALLRTADRRRT
jgi:serine protease